MSENQIEQTITERLESLENQTYIQYLMQNALLKILQDKNIIDKDELAREMDELNERLYELTKDVAENAKKTVDVEPESTDIPEA